MEERYPPVCQSCLPNVQARLQRNNYIAKSTALGGWLKDTKLRPVSSTSKTLISRYLKAVVWTMRGAIWVFASLSMLSWYLAGTINPTETGPSGQSSSWQNLSETAGDSLRNKRHWLPLSIIGAFWSPKGWQLLRDDSLRLDGTTDYNTLQLFIQALRFFSVFIAPHIQASPTIRARMSALCLALSILHIVLSFSILSITRKTEVSLKDNSTNLKDALSNSDKDVYDEHTSSVPKQQSVFQLESMFDKDPILAGDSDEENVRMPGTHDEDAMDWLPSPAQHYKSKESVLQQSNPSSMLSRSPFSTSIQPTSQLGRFSSASRSTFAESSKARDTQPALARQRFFAPERPTGLETLFNAAVTLDDEPMLVRSIKSVQASPGSPLIIIMTWSMVTSILLYRYQLPWIASISGAIMSLCSCAIDRPVSGVQRLELALWLSILLISTTLKYFSSWQDRGLGLALTWSAMLISVICHGYRFLRRAPKRKPARKARNRLIGL